MEYILRDAETVRQTISYKLINQSVSLADEEEVIKTNSPACACCFVSLVTNADIKRLQELVINANDPFFIMLFARITTRSK